MFSNCALAATENSAVLAKDIAAKTINLKPSVAKLAIEAFFKDNKKSFILLFKSLATSSILSTSNDSKSVINLFEIV